MYNSCVYIRATRVVTYVSGWAAITLSGRRNEKRDEEEEEGRKRKVDPTCFGIHCGDRWGFATNSMNTHTCVSISECVPSSLSALSIHTRIMEAWAKGLVSSLRLRDEATAMPESDADARWFVCHIVLKSVYVLYNLHVCISPDLWPVTWPVCWEQHYGMGWRALKYASVAFMGMFGSCLDGLESTRIPTALCF